MQDMPKLGPNWAASENLADYVTVIAVDTEQDLSKSLLTEPMKEMVSMSVGIQPH
jgi:hypothetical protein